MRIFLRLIEIPHFQYQVANEELLNSVIVFVLQGVLLLSGSTCISSYYLDIKVF